ncbi:MAG: AbrB/MazE/SpoVT family DNA-binding domain-containing protein [Defluviitaleaceae bacterium]|nr:AbrB/MazE/SpoVT family DNA-binding domain-containing protein [Defluviitaleaceae bacterium]
MERYSSRGIDELGRMVLPVEIRTKLNLRANMQVSLTPIDTIVILQRVDGEPIPACTCYNYTSTLDELHRVTFSHELLSQQGWKAGSTVALYVNDNIIILKSA